MDARAHAEYGSGLTSAGFPLPGSLSLSIYLGILAVSSHCRAVPTLGFSLSGRISAPGSISSRCLTSPYLGVLVVGQDQPDRVRERLVDGRRHRLHLRHTHTHTHTHTPSPPTTDAAAAALNASARPMRSAPPPSAGPARSAPGPARPGPAGTVVHRGTQVQATWREGGGG